MGTQHTILVIFGITGDLAQRKLLPALRTITHEGLMPPSDIIGISRQDVSTHDVLTRAFGDDTDASVQALADMLDIFTMDVSKDEDYLRLKQAIAHRASHHDGDTQVIFYLSVPPQATLPIVERLGAAGLNDRDTVKLLLEKPFGVDLVSAEETIAVIARYYQESQLYRIDHYLAKEMAQNMLAFRSQNALFRNVWHADHIDHIDIIASEKIGIEGRAGFYEQTGALRDFLQNHLMQLLALTIMDIPSDTSGDALPQARLRALEQIRAIAPDTFADTIVRGQYAGYAEEVANPGSQTETYVGLTLFSDDPRWKAVPIRLATGKNLAKQTTEIRVYFRRAHETEANLLSLHMQPHEGIAITLWAKKPGYDKDFEPIDLHFNYKQTDSKSVEAYERVLLDAFASDKSLFTSAAEVLASWRILQPVQEYWAFNTKNIVAYEPGTPIETLLDATLKPPL